MEFKYMPTSNRRQVGAKRNHSAIRYLVVHDTGNTSTGAGAMSHYRYLQGAQRYGSAHYYLDDKMIIQTIGDSFTAWAIGDKWGYKNNPNRVVDAKNANSISIELCINSDIDKAKAYKNLLELVKNLMKKFNIPPSRVIRHFDATGKTCPGSWSGQNWAKWWAFKEDIKKPIEWEIDLSKGSIFGEGEKSERKKTPILSTTAPMATKEQMEAWAKAKNANPEFIGLANIYWQLFPLVGIDPAIGFAQMAHETGFLYKVKSAAGIDASYHNPCGLKITKGGRDYQASAHKVFPTWQQGILAHRDHLALYAGAAGYPKENTEDPRHFKYLLGTCKYVEDLGGKWAPSKDYGQKILKFIEEMKATKEEERMEEHWAEKSYESLNRKGIEVHDKRFDDYMTRGEVLALLDRIVEDKKEDK